MKESQLLNQPRNLRLSKILIKVLRNRSTKLSTKAKLRETYLQKRNPWVVLPKVLSNLSKRKVENHLFAQLKILKRRVQGAAVVRRYRK